MKLFPELASLEIQDQRKDICKECDYRNGDICSECGCFITLKVKFLKSKCPKNKWPTVTENNSNS